MKHKTTLLSIELDTDFDYDVTHEQAQSELDNFIDHLIDISSFLDDEDSDDDVAIEAAARDWLTEQTGLLVASVEVA